MNQEQIDLSDSSMSDNQSLPNNNPPTSPILEEPSEVTYESPSKKSKTDMPTNIRTLDKPIFPNLPNPYKQTKEDHNFGKASSSRVRAGKNKKKPATTKTYLRVKLPTQVDNVALWNHSINDVILLLRMIWKTLCEVDPQNSTI